MKILFQATASLLLSVYHVQAQDDFGLRALARDHCPDGWVKHHKKVVCGENEDKLTHGKCAICCSNEALEGSPCEDGDSCVISTEDCLCTGQELIVEGRHCENVDGELQWSAMFSITVAPGYCHPPCSCGSIDPNGPCNPPTYCTRYIAYYAVDHCCKFKIEDGFCGDDGVWVMAVADPSLCLTSNPSCSCDDDVSCSNLQSCECYD